MFLVRAVVLFALCSLAFGSTWYISPFGNNNNSGTSKTSPFFDLQTALSHAAKGDTIVAAPGYYSGTANVQKTINGINLIGSAGSAGTVFQGTGSTTRYSYIFSLSGNSNIQGVTVSTAESGLAVNSGETMLTDVTITDMTGAGVELASGAVNITMTSMIFSKCDFGIVDTSSSKIERIILTQSQFQHCDIAIDIDYTSVLKNLTIDGVLFDGTSATSSRAITVSPADDFGTIMVQDSSFKNYHYGTSGTGMYVSGTGDVIIANSIYQNITCSTGCGIYVTGTIDLTIETTLFADNSASSAGGAIYSTSSNPTRVANSTFQNNKASSLGGAIYLYYAGELTADFCSFESNSAPEGGAIKTYASVGATIGDCIFSSNTATNSGGAIFSTSELQVTNSTFNSNDSGDGGAVYTDTSGNESANIELCKFYENSAENGGAIYETAGSKLLVAGALMSGNAATNQGGAVYTEGAFNMIGGVVAGNSAATGGGIYIDSYPSSINIWYTNIQSNNATGNGGGFACVGNAGVFLDEVSFTSNTAETGSAYYCAVCTITSLQVTIDSNNDVACAP